MAGATQELEKPTIKQPNGVSKQSAPEDNKAQAQQTHTPKQEIETPQGVERTRTARVYTPHVDIYEAHDAIVLIVDMPGVDESGLDVTLEKNVLTIYGHVEPHFPEGHTLAYAEYGIGDYQRSFTISNNIDWQHIDGTLKDGVLRLTLRKAGPNEARKIAIKSA